MFRPIDIETPTIDEVGRQFKEVGDFFSAFFRPSVETWSPRFDRGTRAVLDEFINSGAFREAFPQLFPLSSDAASLFSVLNRYEFEGSLIQMLLLGTCTQSIVGSESSARSLATKLLSEAQFDSLNTTAWRMDDPAWSRLTGESTLCSAYFAYNPENLMWWFIGFTDFY